MRDSGSGPSSPFHRTLRFPSQLAALPLSSYYLERGAAGHLAPFSLPFSLSLSLSLPSLPGATSINGRFRVVSDGCVGGLGWRSSHPRHRSKRTDTPKQAGVAADNRRCGARYIYRWHIRVARFCLSVRPSVRPSARRFANAQPGCPVSADDRSHHRVLTAGPASRWGKSAVRHY